MSVEGYWFKTIHCYHDPGCRLALTDEQIASATSFSEWKRDYLRWPGSPSHGPSQNAYHVQKLAAEMANAGCWVGRPLEIKTSREVIEGNHRIRAVKFLHKRHGIVIPEPPSIIIYFRSHQRDETRDVTFEGRCELLPPADQIAQAIEIGQGTGRVVDVDSAAFPW